MMARRSLRRIVPAAVAGTLALLAIVSNFGYAGVGPPFPDRPEGTAFVDDAEAFTPQAERTIDQSLRDARSRTGADLVVYTQIKAASRNRQQVTADAQALVDQWQIGGPEGNGAVLFWDFNRQLGNAVVVVVGGDALVARVGQEALDEVVTRSMADALESDNWVAALTQGTVALSLLAAGEPSGTPQVVEPTQSPVSTPEPAATPAPGEPPEIGAAPPAGPPFGDPIEGVTVYDYAGVFRPETEVSLQRTIGAIEDRTGAEVVVYTQVKPSSDTESEAEADARALMDQWGVGRRGFDDGLVILFDLDDSRCHGQVQLYAGPGYRASYLSNDDRQRTFDQDMVPLLRECDLDGAMIAAMARIDANATAEHARDLTLARQVDAATGLVVAPLALLGLVGWAGWSWLRYGRDPEYLDDPSVLMPAPPPGLTPAAAAVVLDGKANRHALTTAMVDLASRGELLFVEDDSLGVDRVAVEVTEPNERNPRVARNRRPPVGDAEAFALGRLQELADHDGEIGPSELEQFGGSVGEFEDILETHVARNGWYREAPGKSTERWTRRGAIVLIAGVVGIAIGLRLPSNGLTLLGGALLAAGIVTMLLARVMPQRTMSGATVYAWLAAYRRTLQKALEQSRTMDDVVDSHAVPWLETPDQAVVWGYALGLHDEVEAVLERSVSVARDEARTVYLPAWYATAAASSAGVHGSGSAGPSGVFSSSAIPNFGAMTAALSTIGVSVSSSSSSGSSGSGGFSGGSSGGGGGGAGGGF
jgi:uncharacterized membrane protein YgcG